MLFSLVLLAFEGYIQQTFQMSGFFESQESSQLITLSESYTDERNLKMETCTVTDAGNMVHLLMGPLGQNKNYI